MRVKQKQLKLQSISMITILFATLSLVLSGYRPAEAQNIAPLETINRRVNVPYLIGRPFEPSIFWFGKVGTTDNNADVRMWYYDDVIKITVHIIDRQHWQDPSGNISDLTNWDAFSLYFDLDGNTGNNPDSNSYRFDVQLGGLAAAYRGDGSGWKIDTTSTSATTSWRGDQGPNSGIDGKGWEADFIIPFSSFGLASKPPFGTVWGLGAILHDRDDAGGATIRHTVWPETLDPTLPSSWAQLSFGAATYSPPNAAPQGSVFIRQGVNGQTVRDAAVGGHTICGDNVDHWTQWGNTNYAGYSQFNIQNQWDISDWPCFSKYYVTFPLDSIPSGKVILSATLTLTLFGNSGGGVWGEPPDSYIEVFSVAEDWDESTLTWNNAPIALENISGTWVYPRDYSKPDQPYNWNVSKAVNQAYQAGKPLRLAVYSIDGEMHSGKYFWTSDSDEWARPSLNVSYGTPCDSNGVDCNYTYLPLLAVR